MKRSILDTKVQIPYSEELKLICEEDEKLKPMTSDKSRKGSTYKKTSDEVRLKFLISVYRNAESILSVCYCLVIFVGFH
jgi:hypothetical protein